MNFQFYVEKLKDSEEYKKFISENPLAFLSGGFFIIDKETKDKKGEQQHLDFFIPNKKELFSFCLSESCQMSKVDLFEKNFFPEKISGDFNIDFNEIEKVLNEKISKQGIKNSVQKLLFSVQKNSGTNYAIGTIFISNLGLIKFKINLDKKQVQEFEKKSFFDLLKFKKKK
ncbi:hypothetical protein K9L16_03575 [Candidatus Pacearchaeota archaeon]|nr:hypothetical protein [Candidatus Pacearchaeota archaeon]